MSESKKKNIPKFQKKLNGFLSIESGKLVSEDALKMSMITMGIVTTMLWVDQVSAACTTSYASNTVSFWELAGTPTTIDRYYNGWADAGCALPQSRLHGTIYTNAGIAPYYEVVNGHANGNATIQGGWLNWWSLTTDAAYATHSNSWSWSWSWSGSGGGWC